MKSRTELDNSSTLDAETSLLCFLFLPVVQSNFTLVSLLKVKLPLATNVFRPVASSFSLVNKNSGSLNTSSDSFVTLLLPQKSVDSPLFHKSVNSLFTFGLVLGEAFGLS